MESRCALQDRPAHFVAWAGERQDGGRSVGFTGGHYHANLGDENFRKIVLNALLWIAKAKVPPNGVQVTVTPAELTENLDPKQSSVRPQGSGSHAQPPAPPPKKRGN
jgi:hypothetical protein